MVGPPCDPKNLWPPLAALPEAFPPWESCEPYPIPSCGACPTPAAGALRRASPCTGALRRVRPPVGGAGGCQGARSQAGGAKVLVKFLSAKEDLPAAGQVCDTVAFSGALLAKRRLLHAIRSTDRGTAIDLQTAHWLCCAASHCLGIEPQ